MTSFDPYSIGKTFFVVILVVGVVDLFGFFFFFFFTCVFGLGLSVQFVILIPFT